ncbi:MAG TPA: GvpL/GvpF family gas vesicle protein, partial [Candidatus Obscuribacterales bacterium]
VEDWSTVTQQLTATQGPKLEQLFHKLDGRREVGVKVFWDADAELQALLAQNEQLRTERDRLEGKSLSMDEVIRIGQAIEQAVEDRKQSIIQVFQSTLNPLASAALENDPLTEAMIYNAAYLIAWEDEPTFSEKVEALDLQFEGRLRIRYNNFTAPYNFAQLEHLN